MRGVTFSLTLFCVQLFISTHTPHARRDLNTLNGTTCSIISTHTPHARRDITPEEFKADLMEFLLTRLMRGVTTKF